MASNASQASWLIYGASGYTGKLIAQQAAAQGMRPILAGRSESVHEFASTLGLPARVFDLSDASELAAGLADVRIVLNCAGPFSATAEPMIQACLRLGVHYLDITGEISVFEYAHSQHDAASGREVVLCPGVGFDVVPTDCLAAALKAALPDANSLSLGFDSRSPMSPGTSKTMIEGLGEGGNVRRDGVITTVPSAFDVRRIDFGLGEKTAVTIPWGDVATAYYTTGIPNIQCYIAVPQRALRGMRMLRWVRPILGMGFIQRYLKAKVDRKVRGPDAALRAKLTTAVWGEARNAKGELRVARIQTANGYSLTVDSALAITQHLLDRPQTKGGYYTPSLLCGVNLVERLPGSGKIEIGSA